MALLRGEGGAGRGRGVLAAAYRIMSDIGRLLIIFGIGLVVIGGIFLLIGRIPGSPFGRLPGDFSWESGDTRIYFPLATMIVVSIILTIIVNVILRIFR